MFNLQQMVRIVTRVFEYLIGGKVCFPRANVKAALDEEVRLDVHYLKAFVIPIY